MSKYEVDQVLLDEVLNYLASRPYMEVYQMIALIQQCERVENEQDSNG